jgi:hypothetical protein
MSQRQRHDDVRLAASSNVYGGNGVPEPPRGGRLAHYAGR